jgi:hypothetical protein
MLALIFAKWGAHDAAQNRDNGKGNPCRLEGGVPQPTLRRVTWLASRKPPRAFHRVLFSGTPASCRQVLTLCSACYGRGNGALSAGAVVVREVHGLRAARFFEAGFLDLDGAQGGIG